MKDLGEMSELVINYLPKKLPQFCENTGFGNVLYSQYSGLYHFLTVKKINFN